MANPYINIPFTQIPPPLMPTAPPALVIDVGGVRIPEEDSDTGVSALYLSQENNEMFVSLIRELRENAEIKVFTDLL